MKFNGRLRFIVLRAAGFLGGMIALACGAIAMAGPIIGAQSLDLDFTKPDVVGQVSWTPTGPYLKLGSDGLNLALPKGASIGPFQLQTTEPLALGYPLRGAGIRATLSPIASPGRLDNGKTFPSDPGTLFARYSADTKHWSTWQPLPAPAIQQQCYSSGRAYSQCYVFSGELRVPQQQSEEFDKLCREYETQRLGMSYEKQRCAQWIVTSQPDFFATHTPPVIGYVQFLFEDRNFSGGRRIEHLDLFVTFGLGGNVHQNTAWDFRAP
jgi:hypothetical protein